MRVIDLRKEKEKKKRDTVLKGLNAFKKIKDYEIEKEKKYKKAVLKELGALAISLAAAGTIIYLGPYTFNNKKYQIEIREDSINDFLNDTNISKESKLKMEEAIFAEDLSINGEYTKTKDKTYEKVTIENYYEY
jgi:hypothetical protein